MSYLEELLPEFRKGAKIKRTGVIQPTNAKGYIFYKEGKIYNEFGKECDPDLGFWLSKNDWELYQEPIDWQYIIKNKCLCWFWDDNPNYVMRLGYLTRLMDSCPNNEGFIYCKDNGMAFKNCRPVRRDEVTFYEDKEDEKA